MTVRELMQALSAFDPEMPVVIPSDAGTHQWTDVVHALLDYAVCSGDGRAQPTYPDDAAGRPIVMLYGPSGPDETYFRNAAEDD